MAESAGLNPQAQGTTGEDRKQEESTASASWVMIPDDPPLNQPAKHLESDSKAKAAEDSAPLSLAHKYDRALKLQPIKTKLITAAVVNACADLLSHALLPGHSTPGPSAGSARSAGTG
mmetsp:Transcript_38928/g.58267  ORF Transcript_38928/g.58267 Transcript_38928/m.58267 type:complete len:118 (+) Transcript_38928:46-399(+)